jgi:hypothetical protein
MKKTDLNKVVKDFVKWVNENKEGLGRAEDVMIAPKLSAEEMETMLDSLGEAIAETLGDGPLKDQFINEYNNVASAFDLFKKEGEKEAPPETKPPATGIFQAQPAPADTLKVPPVGAPPQAQPTKQPKTKKAQEAPPKQAVVTDDKDRAIKKLFELLSSEAVDSLDPATMRTVLRTMK